MISYCIVGCDIHGTDEETRCPLNASSIPASRAKSAAQISSFAGCQSGIDGFGASSAGTTTLLYASANMPAV
ncbi:hypothetical protein WJX79_006084 [Trebouxia sp. C0005]